MKKLFLLAVFTLFSSVSFAGATRVEQVCTPTTTIAGTGTTYISRVFSLGSIDKMGYWMKGGKAALKPEPVYLTMYMEGSYDTTASNFATMTDIVSVYSASRYSSEAIASCGTVSTLPACKYGRFVIQGLTNNATGTTVSAYIFTQED